MAYTNGYDFSTVMTALSQRLGWQQPAASGSPTINATNTTSGSGRYFNDGSFHNLVTVDNVKQTMEEAGASDANLNAKLTALSKAAVMRSLHGVFGGPTVIEQARLFQRYGHNDQLIENSGLFAGYEIDVADTFDSAVQIDAIHLMMDGAATFNVYLFADGNPTAVWSQSVTTVAGKVVTVSLTDKVLTQGKYFLGYFQADLGSVKAYQEQVKSWAKTYRFSARPMTAEHTGGTTFDRENRTYPSPAYGLNADMSSFVDQTEQIKKKAAAFDELIGLQMAYQVIEQVVYAVRSNVNERILKDTLDKAGIQLDLNGAAPISEGPKVTGLKQRIEKETKRVKELFYPAPKIQNVNLC